MIALGLLLAIVGSDRPHPPAVTKGFTFRGEEFLLNGKPFQIIAGEIHPARIPAEYWRHRIQMVRAMGCNTISSYIFWNYHETSEGHFDFISGNHDLAKFFRICKQEGMNVILRPGPYCCAEWDFGGLPSYLLKYPDIKVRCMDPRYIAAAKRYIGKLAEVVKPLMSQNGGPILMVQVENEFGSYGNDREYMKWVHNQWLANGIKGPFYTGDGPAEFMLEPGSLPGCAVGLDSGSSESDWQVARKMNPGVPIFSSETYPGWLTHWGEKWAAAETKDVVKEVSWLLANKKSFNLYVAHGGTNFGWWAGANSGGKGYEPDVTSYDYDAPIAEQGRPTPKFFAIRNEIAKYGPLGPIPEPIPTTSVPVFTLKPSGSVWDSYQSSIKSTQPKPFEAVGLSFGFMIYKTKLVGHKSGRLEVHDVHDYATVFVDGKYVGTIDRREGRMGIDLPATKSKTPLLEILVEGMGRINYGKSMIDRKGITDRVTFNGMTLMNWEMIPIEGSHPPTPHGSAQSFERPGINFSGAFNLAQPADTYLDLSEFVKGVVWVNGHCLGRYWNIGPQKRLYCPASWLHKGENRVVVFDLHKTTLGQIQGFDTLEP